MASRYSMKWMDHSGESSSTGLYFASPSGAAFDWDTFQAAVENVGDELELISDCALDGESLNVVILKADGTPASTATAQREIGIRVFYSDDVTGKRYHFTIPGPEVAKYPAQGSDNIDLSVGDFATMVTAIEADCVSELGNAITVASAKLVGRRN